MALFTKGKEIFNCPIEGIIEPLDKTPDAAFAQGMMGDGIVIFPKGNQVYAPVDARVNFTFPTRHAIQLETNTGIEFLIHVGIDTNTLQGEGFQVFVEPKEMVKKGQLLMEFDLALLQTHGLSSATPVVFANANKTDIEVVKTGYVKANEELLIVKK